MSEHNEALYPEEYFTVRTNEIMKEKGIDAKELAAKTKIKLNTLYSYLRSPDMNLKTPQSIPPVTAGALIAEALDTSLDYLCGVNETKRIKVERELTATTLLANLYRAIKDAGFTVDLDGSGTCTLTSKNHFIYLFLSQVSGISNEAEFEKILSLFGDLHIINNQLVDTVTYANYLYNEFVYDGIGEEEQALYPEECAEEIKKRSDTLHEEIARAKKKGGKK